MRKEEKLNLVGKRFGKFTAICRVKSQTRDSRWLCICDCGREKVVLLNSLLRGSSKNCKMKSCSSIWVGYEEITGAFWNKILYSANKRKVELSIDKQYAWELYLKQNTRCSLTNLLINSSNWSLDRIDSSQGYIIGNVQWIFKELQFVKRILSQEKFIDWCRKITLYQKEQGFEVSL